MMKQEITIKLLSLVTLFITVTMLSGCMPSAVVLGEVDKTPTAYANTIMKRGLEEKVINEPYRSVVKKLNALSEKCYQFSIKIKDQDPKLFKEVYRGKVTRLSASSTIFTLQYERVEGRKVVYSGSNKPDGGLWDFGIIFDEAGSSSTKAGMFVPYGMMRKRVVAVVDAINDKYGDKCPPEELLY